MEEKNTLAPWEELNQIHEQISTPTETAHPAKQISSAHESLKEAKESPEFGAELGAKYGTGYAIGRWGLERAVDIAKKRFGNIAVLPSTAPGAPFQIVPNSGNAIKDWAKTQYKDIPFQGGIDYKHEHQLTQPLRNTAIAQHQLNKLNALFPTLPPTVPTMATPTLATPKPSVASRIMNMPMHGLEKVLPYAKNIVGGAGKLLGPVAAGANAGYQGLESAQRFETGDPIGGIINAIGAAGSLASLYPTLPTVALGTGAATGAEALNAYRDKLRSGAIKHEAPNYENVNPAGDIGYAEGGLAHMSGGGKLGMLKELGDLIKSEGRTPVVPASSEWFKGTKGPQPLIEKVLQKTGKERSDYPYGAFVDPRTGEVLDQNIYGSTGVLIDPLTGRPMMSVENQLESLMPKNGLVTQSNLLKKDKYNVLGGDSVLENSPFIATIDSGPGHFYSLGTEYATPTQLRNLEKGTSNPFLRPYSNGDLFGMGDVIGQVRPKSSKKISDVYEKLFVAPKGSDVPGVRLNRASGGAVHMSEGRQPTVTLEELDTTTPETGAAFGKFPQMTPKRAQPQGGALHGYLDALLGAPKNEDMSVIVPQEMAYRKAYDAAEPYGMAANMVAPVTSLGKSVGKPLVKALGEHAVDKVFSGEPLIKGMDFLNPQVLGIIKNKGGNWLNPMSEEFAHTLSKRAVDPSDTARIQELKNIGHTENLIKNRINRGALNNWTTSNWGNYTKNLMGTTEDPIRQLAEEGISHLPPNLGAYNGALKHYRRDAGFPEEGVAKSDLAKQWENIVDNSLKVRPRKDFILDPKEKPWMDKLSNDTPIYNLRGGSDYYLGLNHIKDILQEQLNSGQLRPENLKNLSVTDAVRRVHLHDQEMAKKAEQAAAARMENVDVHKEYPTGFKWVQLNQPGQFSEESNIMGHSVRGYEPSIGHPDWIDESGSAGHSGYGHGGWEAIQSGKAKIYSLRDPKGLSHVTIEIGKREPLWHEIPKEVEDASYNLLPKSIHPNSQPAEDWRRKYIADWKKENPIETITQIKGKGNEKPNKEYIPYAQDFVKSIGHKVEGPDINNLDLD